MILHRLQTRIDKHLRPNQNGFRPGRSTTSHILALRRLLEGVKSHNLKAIAIFVDFQKAFDSVNRSQMFKILLAYGIPRKLVDAIKKLYENTRAKVLSPDGETEFIDITTGVQQGDTLAPYLFAIVLDFAMRRAIDGHDLELGFKLKRRTSSRTQSVTITDLDFADDIVLLTEEVHQAQQILRSLEEEAKKIGLHLNNRKTEVMAFNHSDQVSITTVLGSEVKTVNNFKYLGSWIESSEKDYEVRKALAWSVCNKMNKIWTSKLYRNIKERLFIATVETVLLYGSETWTIGKAMEKRIDGCYTRMLRKAMNIS